MIEFIEYKDPDRIRVTFFHDVLQYALIALIKSGKESDTIYWGIKHLCSKFSKGRIEHPLMENSNIYPIWPIYDTLLVFHEYISSLNKTNWNNVIILYPSFIGRKTHTSTKYNPLSYLLKIPNFVYYVVALFFMCYILTKFNFLSILITWLSDFLNKSDNSNINSILCNLIASVLILLLSFLFKKIIEKYCNRKDFMKVIR